MCLLGCLFGGHYMPIKAQSTELYRRACVSGGCLMGMQDFVNKIIH